MQARYDLGLVALSVAIAWLASYASLSLAGRAVVGRRQQWLIAAAVVMSMGIWSMHFVGMLAFELPIAIGYNIEMTLLSGLVAVASSLLALAVVTRHEPVWKHFAACGLIMGAGVAVMHYTGMSAMRMLPQIRYSAVPFALSLLIAAGAATLALILVFETSRDQGRLAGLARRLTAAAVMAVGIAGMHYTGMDAAEFAPNAYCREVASGLGREGLASLVTLGVLLTLLITAMNLRFDARYVTQGRHYAGLLNQAREQIAEFEQRDPLTGVLNRVYFELELKALRTTSASEPRRALMLIDLSTASPRWPTPSAWNRAIACSWWWPSGCAP